MTGTGCISDHGVGTKCGVLLLMTNLMIQIYQVRQHNQKGIIAGYDVVTLHVIAKVVLPCAIT